MPSDNQLFSLSGKHALITGASHGIGFSIAKGLAQAGATIAFNSSSKEHLEQALAAYEEEAISARGFLCDVTDERQVQEMIGALLREWGSLEILVNNAGVIARTPLTEMALEDFQRVIDVDLTAAFLLSKAVLPSMMEHRQGKIINICSLMSELGRETVSAYAAAKGGLKMLTKSIASEYGAYGIQCNGIGPGYIATSQTAPLRQIQEDGSTHPFDRFIKDRTPARRWGSSEDLLGPAIFLASEASDFVNGQILYVDGGLLSYLGK